MEKPWNGTCPSCKNTQAYQSCFSWLCPNISCKYYEKSQLDLVLDYEMELERKQVETDKKTDKEMEKENKEDEIPFEERDTIPYYPTTNIDDTLNNTFPDDDYGNLDNFDDMSPDLLYK